MHDPIYEVCSSQPLITVTIGLKSGKGTLNNDVNNLKQFVSFFLQFIVNNNNVISDTRCIQLLLASVTGVFITGG